MDPDCLSLLALFASYFPQAHITLLTLEHQCLFNLFIADERVIHCIVFSHAGLPSVMQMKDFIEESDLAAFIELSPVALRLAIADEAGHLSYNSRAMAHA